jgi:hypothetical protein
VVGAVIQTPIDHICITSSVCICGITPFHILHYTLRCSLKEKLAWPTNRNRSVGSPSDEECCIVTLQSRTLPENNTSKIPTLTPLRPCLFASGFRSPYMIVPMQYAKHNGTALSCVSHTANRCSHLAYARLQTSLSAARH